MWTFILSVYAGSAKSYTPEKQMEMQQSAGSLGSNNNNDEQNEIPAVADPAR